MLGNEDLTLNSDARDEALGDEDQITSSETDNNWLVDRMVHELDLRDFCESLDTLTDEAIAKLPEGYVDKVLYAPNRIDNFMQSYWNGEYEGEMKYDVPSRETIGSLLSHGADPDKLARAMTDGAHYGDPPEDFGWGLPLVAKNLDLLVEHGFNPEQFIEDTFKNSLGSGELYEMNAYHRWPQFMFDRFKKGVPAMIEAGANAKEIFSWAKPIADTAQELHENYTYTRYGNEIESAFTDSLETIIQRRETTEEIIDFVTRRHHGTDQDYANRAFGIILDNIEAFNHNEDFDTGAVLDKLVDFGRDRDIFRHFDDLVKGGIDPVDLAATLAGANFTYLTGISDYSVVKKLQEYNLEPNFDLVASKAAEIDAPKNVWFLKQYDRQGVHINAGELLSHWPANDDNTFQAIHENIGDLIRHGLTDSVINSLVDDEDSHHDLVRNLRNEYAEYNRVHNPMNHQ